MHRRYLVHHAVDLAGNGDLDMNEKAINAVALLIMLCMLAAI